LSQKIDSFKNCFSLYSVLLLESYWKTIRFLDKHLLQSMYVMRKHGSHLPISKLKCSENIHTYYIVVPWCGQEGEWRTIRQIRNSRGSRCRCRESSESGKRM
jgi:hypothetical protein